MHKGCREPRALTATTGFSLQRISGAPFPVLHLQVRQARRQLPSPFHLPCHHWQIPAGLSGIFSSLHSRSEEHTSELQSLMRISYAVFCLKKTIHHGTKQPTVKSRYFLHH